MVRRSVAGLVVVDFFTPGYRISGHLSTRTHTVADLLNERLTSYLELEDVYISRVSNPGEIVAAYRQAQLHKENLLFAIVPGKERFAQAGRSVSYFGKQRNHVWLALPTFEIEGDLQVAGRAFDLEAFLTKQARDYIPILSATAQATAWPEVTFSGEVFLVNKRAIDLFCLSNNE